MTFGPRWWLLVLAFVLVGVVVGRGIAGSCGRDEAGQRADSVLADTMRYVRTIRAQDSLLLTKDSIIEATDRDRSRWKRVALASLQRDDADQAAVDSTVAAGVPDSVAPAVFWKDQWEEQRRITARLRSETVPALLATIEADSVGIAQRDEYASEMRSQRDFARARVNEITQEFRDYRAATKPGIDLGLFRVPEWVGYAAVVVGTATATVIVVK